MKNLKAILNSGLAFILLCVSLLWGCRQGQDQMIVFSEANKWTCLEKMMLTNL